MKHIVGVGDMCISANRGDTLITYALGSCLGITVHDVVAGVGGLLHVMLPLSTIDEGKAKENPYMFVDTGVPTLFQECYKAGARRERLAIKVAGGASSSGMGEDYFQIGKRNCIILRKLLWKNGFLLKSEDVGGCQSRTMSLDIQTGAVTIKSNGTISSL